MSVARAVLCLFNYYRGLDGRWTPLVTSDAPLAESSSETTWLGKFSVGAGVKASVGVSQSVRGSAGTSCSTTGCVVIQIQGKHLGTCACRRSLVTFLPFLRHLSQTFTTWDSSYTHTTQIFLLLMLHCWGRGQWNLKETPWQVTNVR